MTWHVQFTRAGVSLIRWHATPEQAIESACKLIDDGCDVFGIGTGPLTNSIARRQIGRIHAFWARTRKLPGAA